MNTLYSLLLDNIQYLKKELG